MTWFMNIFQQKMRSYTDLVAYFADKPGFAGCSMILGTKSIHTVQCNTHTHTHTIHTKLGKHCYTQLHGSTDKMLLVKYFSKRYVSLLYDLSADNMLRTNSLIIPRLF